MTKTSDVHQQIADQVASHRWALYTQMAEPEVIERLGAIYDLQLRLGVEKLHTVTRARALGVSWSRIGTELNISAQAAWEQWHHLDAQT